MGYYPSVKGGTSRKFVLSRIEIPRIKIFCKFSIAKSGKRILELYLLYKPMFLQRFLPSDGCSFLQPPAFHYCTASHQWCKIPHYQELFYGSAIRRLSRPHWNMRTIFHVHLHKITQFEKNRPSDYLWVDTPHYLMLRYFFPHPCQLWILTQGTV